MTDLTLFEVLRGVRDDTDWARTRAALSRFPVMEAAGAPMADRAAVVYRKLRALGFTPRARVDCFLMAFCLAGRHALLHRDRDFDPAEEHLGLRVLHP